MRAAAAMCRVGELRFAAVRVVAVAIAVVLHAQRNTAPGTRCGRVRYCAARSATRAAIAGGVQRGFASVRGRAVAVAIARVTREAAAPGAVNRRMRAKRAGHAARTAIAGRREIRFAAVCSKAIAVRRAADARERTRSARACAHRVGRERARISAGAAVRQIGAKVHARRTARCERR